MSKAPPADQWEVNQEAMQDLSEMPAVTNLPSQLSQFANKSLIYYRIMRRETSSIGSAVERVILLTKQHLYVCTIAGDVKRMITVTSITGIVAGNKRGIPQVLLKIPEQDMILNFDSHPLNPPTATMEEFLDLIQHIYIAWKNKMLSQVNVDGPVGANYNANLLSSKEVHEDKKVEEMIALARQNAPPPNIAAPELKACIDEAENLKREIQRKTIDLQNELALKERYTSQLNSLREEVNTLRQSESIANLPAAMGIRYAQTNAHAENIIAAADELQHENDELRAQIDHYKSIVEGSRVSGAQASQQLTTEIESLQAEIELEKANQEKHAKAARSHKILSQLVATICYQNVHKLVSMYEGNYNKAMHAKDTALDLAQKRVDELQHNLMKISITGVQPRGVGTYSHPSLTPIQQQPQQQQMDHPLLNLMGGSQSGVGVGSASPNRVRAGSIPNNATNTSRHLMESPPKSASAKKMLSAKFL